MPVMVVGTFRDNEVEPSSPLARILNQLVRERLVTRVALRPLTEEDVAALVAGLTGQQPPAAFVHGIYAQSEGNPFFAEEIYLHLAESGVLFDDQGRFRDDLRIEDLEVPSSVRMVVGERLARLSEATQRALLAAAVRGRVFELDLVERVAGEPGGDLLDAFDEAERARLITPSKSGASSYTFAHELIRQTLLANASTIRRRRLHLAIAAALEAVHADDLEAYAADLAYHLARGGAGGQDGRLVRYLRMAGDRAMETAAYAEAADHFARAVSLLEREPGAQEQDRGTLAELVERLAMALRSQGRWDEALKVMDEALRLYEALGRTDALGRLCGVMSYQLGWAAKWEEAVAVASRGLAALGDLPNPDRARLLAAAAWVSGLAGDYAGATGMFAAARELAGQLGDEAALADVLQLQTIHHMAWVELADGVAAGLRAAELYEATGSLWELTGVLAFVEYEHRTLARPEPTAAHAARLTGLAERVAPMAERLGHLGAEFLVGGQPHPDRGGLPGRPGLHREDGPARGRDLRTRRAAVAVRRPHLPRAGRPLAGRLGDRRAGAAPGRPAGGSRGDRRPERRPPRPPPGPRRPREGGGRDRRGPPTRVPGGRQDQLDRGLEHAPRTGRGTRPCRPPRRGGRAAPPARRGPRPRRLDRLRRPPGQHPGRDRRHRRPRLGRRRAPLHHGPRPPPRPSATASNRSTSGSGEPACSSPGTAPATRRPPPPSRPT